MDNQDLSVRHRSSISSYEKELPLAAEYREVIELVVSRCFLYLRLHNFENAFPDVDEELLKRLHDQMITNLHTFISEKICDVLNETQITSSLNELYQLIKSQPVKFTKVWRPSGNAQADLEAHIQNLSLQCETLLTDMLNQLKQENARKWAEIAEEEEEIIKIQEEITRITNKIKAAELRASSEVKLPD